MNTVPTVAVYVTDDAIFVISEKMSDVGRVTNEPMQRLDRGSPPAVLGKAVLDGLDAFVDSDDPSDPDALQMLLDFVGARSWKAFATSAINISVAVLSKDTVGLSPARANGRGAYLFGDTHKCAHDANTIGEMLLQLAGDAWET